MYRNAEEFEKPIREIEEQIASLPRQRDRFEPRMPAAARDRLHEGWREAVARARAGLQELVDRLATELGPEGSEILASQLLILEDVLVWDATLAVIRRERINAEAAFARAGQLVVSPGVSVDEPPIAAAAARGVPVIGDIELFARMARAPVIAITGSNGKSTVTMLVSAMAQHAGRDVRTGGNIGTPALDLLQDVEPDLYVLELSSFQLETTHSLRAAASVVLNVSADHMDRYAHLDDYRRAKQTVYHGAGVQVVNADDNGRTTGTFTVNVCVTIFRVSQAG